MRKIIATGLFFWLLSLLLAKSQEDYGVQNHYKFKYLTIDQGLSNNHIRSICQDSKGFIWFATSNGLNKFNGQDIVTYWKSDNDSTTISSTLISAVFLDSKDNLWACGSGGLDRYNAELDNFVRFNHKDIDWPIDHIYTAAEDKQGNLWFGGITGLYCYNLSAREVTYYSNAHGNKHELPPKSVYYIFVDSKNRVWVSMLNGGLYVLDQETFSHTIFKHDPLDTTTISGDRIETIYEDHNGTLWFGTLNNGLNQFNPDTKTFQKFIPDPENIYSTRVRTIFEDLKGNFFIGTRAGLYRFNKKENTFFHYADEGHKFSRLSQNSVITSFIDNTGMLWVGTFSGGVNYTNLNRKDFTHYVAGKDNNHFLSGANIYAVTEDPKGNLWIGGDNGLNYLDRTDYTFTYFKNDPMDPSSLSYDDVKALEWDKKGNLWVGTNRGGLNYYNVKTGEFTAYKHDPNDSNSIAGNKIYCLMNDKFNNLWIIISPNNQFNVLYVDILPDGQDKFIHLKETAYLGFDEDDDGNVFIGGVKGFWIFQRSDSVFKFISKPEYIGSVNTLKKDSHGDLWIGSTKGLVRYTMDSQTFKWYSHETNYPISEVFGILEDDSTNLWVSTASGLLKIEDFASDTSLPSIHVYDHYDGLQSKQFNYNAYYKCRSGEMAFGGINGLNTFYPNRIVENKIPAKAIITNLKVFNETVPIGEKVDGKVLLEKAITVTDEIVLGPRHKIFTLEFATLQNSNPEKYVFKTKLEGLDKNWQYRKIGNNQVTYTNLTPGDYTFLISAANSDGLWSENPVALKIKVIPPVWQTWWFRILGAILALSFISVIYYFRVRSIRYQNMYLEQTVEKRTGEVTEKNIMLQEANSLLKEKQEQIMSQNDELEQHRNNLTELVNNRTHELKQALERAEESDALKSAFLANMSHEIRTPMNAIMGFSNMLNDEDYTADEREEFITLIQSNSNDLLKIIDEILDLSLIESNQMKLEKEVFELNVVFDHVLSYFYLNNTNNSLEIRKNNSLEQENIKLNSDSLRFKQVITNLMDNACKFTEEGYVELGVYATKSHLCLYVKDTGRGIPKSELQNVFEQFTKVEDDTFGWTRGLGLGLAISQKIAESLGGKISVESEEEKGSLFSFTIPLDAVLSEGTVELYELNENLSDKWKTKKILIAEDVEANYIFLQKVLKKTNATILWAKNGEEAIAMAKETPDIDLILMDIKMPKMTGYDAAKIIKKNNPNQIIVAQTAYARTQEKYKFYDKNFDEYISKPIIPSSLLDILDRFLKH